MTLKKLAIVEILGIGGFSSQLDRFGMTQYELRQLGISVLHLLLCSFFVF